jgi:hypothetical protein
MMDYFSRVLTGLSVFSYSLLYQSKGLLVNIVPINASFNRAFQKLFRIENRPLVSMLTFSHTLLHEWNFINFNNRLLNLFSNYSLCQFYAAKWHLYNIVNVLLYLSFLVYSDLFSFFKLFDL